MTKTFNEKPFIRISEAGMCPKALSAMLLGYEATEEPMWLADAAEEGNWHEDRIVQQLQDGKLYIPGYGKVPVLVDSRQAEVSIDTELFNLIGHIDGKAYIEDKVFQLEIKTMSQFVFDRWMRYGFENFEQYATQITTYSYATGLSDILYIAKNRSSGYTDIRIIKPPLDINDIWQNISDVIVSVNAGNLFECEADFSTTKCKQCRYNYLCTPKEIEMEPQTTIALEIAAADYRRGIELKTEADELLDNAKSVFKQHLKANDLKQFYFDNLIAKIISVKKHTVPEHTKKAYEYIRLDDKLENFK
jgi:hypothetical protein